MDMRLTKYSLLIATIILQPMSFQVMASRPGVEMANCRSTNMPTSIPAPIIVVNNSLEVGDVIPGSGRSIDLVIQCYNNLTNTNSDAHVACDDSPSNNWTIGGAGFSKVASVPSTVTYRNLPAGVGVQFLDENGNPQALAPSGVRVDLGVKPIAPGASQVVPMRMRLVKTADITVGGVTTGTFQVSCVNREWANYNDTGSTVSFMTDISIQSETCSMSPPSKTVNLTEVTRTQFSGVGTEAGNTFFNLSFDCDANTSAVAYFTDSIEPNNESDTLALDSSSTATGVGVKLFMPDGASVLYSPLKIFDPTTAPSNSYLTLDNSMTDSLHTFDFAMSASYVQTDTTITSGTVKSLAEVSIAYQ